MQDADEPTRRHDAGHVAPGAIDRAATLMAEAARDQYATAAINGLIASNQQPAPIRQAAIMAFDYADAMVRERLRRPLPECPCSHCLSKANERTAPPCERPAEFRSLRTQAGAAEAYRTLLAAAVNVLGRIRDYRTDPTTLPSTVMRAIEDNLTQAIELAKQSLAGTD